MSPTATTFDTRESLAAWTQSLVGMYNKDLVAIGNERFTDSIGGKTRTPQDFTAEVIGLCMMVTGAILGHEVAMPSDEDRAAFRTSLSSVEIAQAKLQEATEGLVAALKSLPENELGATVMAPWGEPIGKYAFANLAINHIWYHDGQLNYIQAFHGDTETHWM